MLITFDDGYESIFKEAYPIMSKLDLVGLVFPISSYIGKANTWDVNFLINKKRHMTSKQLLELHQHGWEIGSHGDCHRSYRFLSDKEIKNDMSISKQILEDMLQKAVTSFAPPFGYYNSYILNVCDSLGYKKIFIQKPLTYTKRNNKFNVEIIYRRSIYSIDTECSIKRKTRNSSIEILKENFIHSCSIATAVIKKSFDI